MWCNIYTKSKKPLICCCHIWADPKLYRQQIRMTQTRLTMNIRHTKRSTLSPNYGARQVSPELCALQGQQVLRVPGRSCNILGFQRKVNKGDGTSWEDTTDVSSVSPSSERTTTTHADGVYPFLIRADRCTLIAYYTSTLWSLLHTDRVLYLDTLELVIHTVRGSLPWNAWCEPLAARWGTLWSVLRRLPSAESSRRQTRTPPCLEGGDTWSSGPGRWFPWFYPGNASRFGCWRWWQTKLLINGCLWWWWLWWW